MARAAGMPDARADEVLALVTPDSEDDMRELLAEERRKEARLGHSAQCNPDRTGTLNGAPAPFAQGAVL